ncbi:2Fe-2S iron-sulfur cluster-binding protein [Prochlorothrix hollandica]|uniref:Ferredoxin n=1 Tax=Prochlorothrix hollandica PCC 9006 = CALU 1027 TaxID=317619 RepID=A0A0M2PRW3_PROHO|nr:2Fe-2S iron-sulfur cluster-binding protein [Prochlorothrix hollandica]KKI99290.1 ferredoxin [Prochlorothrix hollandica PCC 9006 = CALU 1027]
MAVYQVRLSSPDGSLDRTLAVPDDQYILDVADAAGIRLPAGCLQGECSVCLAKVVYGEVDQREQRFLQEPERQQGFTVTCVAYARSDCHLLTHQEAVVYPDALYGGTQP